MAVLGNLFPWGERLADIVLLDKVVSRLDERFDAKLSKTKIVLLTVLASMFLLVVGLMAYVFVSYIAGSLG